MLSNNALLNSGDTGGQGEWRELKREREKESDRGFGKEKREGGRKGRRKGKGRKDRELEREVAGTEKKNPESLKDHTLNTEQSRRKESSSKILSLQ